jgi:hypothetical protein
VGVLAAIVAQRRWVATPTRYARADVTV